MSADELRRVLKADRYSYQGYQIVNIRGRGYERDDESVRYRDQIQVSLSPTGRSFRMWWNGIEIERPAPPDPESETP